MRNLMLALMLAAAGLFVPAHAQNWIALNNGYLNSYLSNSASENVASSMNVALPIQGAPGVLATGATSQICANNFDWSQHPPVIYPSLAVGAQFDRDPSKYVITTGTQLMT